MTDPKIPAPEPAYWQKLVTGQLRPLFAADQMESYAAAREAAARQSATHTQLQAAVIEATTECSAAWQIKLDEAVAAAVAAERERLCAAIKAEDDHCADGDYMLDSDDCISVIRGTWKRPEWDYNKGRAG